MRFSFAYEIVVCAGLAALMSAASGCGSNSAQEAIDTGVQTDTDIARFEQSKAAYKPVNVDLESSLRDLADLRAPDGVDPATFEQLKSSLGDLLRQYYGCTSREQLARRVASGVSASQLSQPWCGDARVTPQGAITLSWRGRHAGDYDLNGEVNISDISPLAMFYFETAELDPDGLPVVSGENEWKGQVDGDRNTEINISDLTPIAANFSSRLLGFRVYYGLDSGSGLLWEPDPIPNPEDAGLPYTLPFGGLRTPGKVLQYDLGFTRPAVPTGTKAYVNIVPFDGVQELTGFVVPLHAGPHAPIGCNSCHKLTDYSFKGVDNACKLCHAAPFEDKQAAWTSAPGQHGSCLSCHTQHGFTISPPQSVCGSCHSDIATAVTAIGMPNCLGCHQTPHLPNAQPNKTQCNVCHSDKAATLSDELMQECTQCHSAHGFTQTYTPQLCMSCHTNPDNNKNLDWINAPGAHGTCSNCHNLHDFKIAEPNTLCVTCHQNKVDDNHSLGNLDCLSCHSSPHIPTTFSGACIQCHPTPPGQPNRTWAEAPGLHGDCGQCHDPKSHGSKPVPPESICVNCHAGMMATHAPPGKTCVECHNFYHVPDVTRGAAGCVICHPAPPENLLMAWTDAPGQHAECLLCHPGTHPDKPVPPESVCMSCHSTTFADKHQPSQTACLTCHTFPHLPTMEYNMSSANCLECHSGYVGDGTHTGSCLDCHQEKKHPPLDGWDHCGECHPY